MNYIKPIKDDSKKDYKLLVKHNKLVQSKYSLTANEQKLLYKIFEEIQKNGYKTREVTLTFEDFYREYKQIIGRKITKNDFRYTLEAIQDKKPYIIDMDNDTYIRTQWYAIKGKLDLSEITLIIDDLVFEYIQSLDKNFTGLRIATLYSFKNFYTMRIYELLKQWSSVKREIIYKVDTLKSLLGLEEIEQVEKDGSITVLNSGYRNFGIFDRKILKKAVNEINEKSELKVSYTTKKKGRKIVEVIFKVEEKNIVMDRSFLSTDTSKNDVKVEHEKIGTKEDNRQKYNIPVPLLLEENLYFVFNKEFGHINFEEIDNLLLLLQAQSYTLEKDNSDVININNYNLFRTSLTGKISKAKKEKEELELLGKISDDEYEDWQINHPNLTIQEYFKMAKEEVD